MSNHPQYTPRHAPALLAALASAFLACPATAVEYPIGAPVQRYGMEITAVYLQPVTMEPDGMMRAPAETDIHLEADVRALSSNANGFAEGAWIPSLKVRYELRKEGAPDVVAGDLMQMVANDGPHYGDNVKLKGPGRYKLTFRVDPPSAADPHNAFGRHTDRLTGVRPWFKPFEVEYEFSYVGIGKKGGY